MLKLMLPFYKDYKVTHLKSGHLNFARAMTGCGIQIQIQIQFKLNDIVAFIFHNSAQQFLKTGEGGIIAGLIALLHNGVW